MRKVYFEIPQWAVLLDAETDEKVLEAPREYCIKVAAYEKWEIIDPPSAPVESAIELNISADMIRRGYKGEAVDPADGLPPIDVNAKEFTLGVNKYGQFEMAATDYSVLKCRERQLAAAREQVLQTRLAFVLSDAILPEGFEPELPPTQRLHSYIAKQHERMQQAVEKLELYGWKQGNIAEAIAILKPKGSDLWL